ncbi:hypothetical protein BKA69DRAFT_846622 [Paraphysoderma sedebokerense]|nr:hypothetical protein BKA69DRAFT_846622 [Paraphysoderma sedebokerense]
MILIVHRPDVLYLASEYPPTILEFSKSKSTVIRSWDLSPQFGYRKKDGLEAITFIPDASVPTGGYFYVGRQRDARIFVFDVPVKSKSETKELNFRGYIIPPGPGFDLSALYYHNSTLYLLFDKPQVLIPISLPANSDSNSEVKSKYLPSSQSATLSLDASRDHVTTIPTLERGQEAISIAMVDGVSYVFFGIDVNGKKIKNSSKHPNEIKVSVQGSNGNVEDEIYIRKPVRGLRRYTC